VSPYAAIGGIAALPVGAILDWPKVPTQPSHYPDAGTWMECQGQQLDKNTYPDLFALIGTQFGGNGNPNFNLPELSRKVVVGRHNCGCPAGNLMNAPGLAGGEENHTLATNEMPNHNHTAYCIVSALFTNQLQSGTGPYASCVVTSTNTTSSCGSSNQHNNLQPYVVLCKLIKVKP
jgi:microcystin-dependent protein